MTKGNLRREGQERQEWKPRPRKTAALGLAQFDFLHHRSTCPGYRVVESSPNRHVYKTLTQGTLKKKQRQSKSRNIRESAARLCLLATSEATHEISLIWMLKDDASGHARLDREKPRTTVS